MNMTNISVDSTIDSEDENDEHFLNWTDSLVDSIDLTKKASSTLYEQLQDTLETKKAKLIELEEKLNYSREKYLPVLGETFFVNIDIGNDEYLQEKMKCDVIIVKDIASMKQKSNQIKADYKHFIMNIADIIDSHGKYCGIDPTERMFKTDENKLKAELDNLREERKHFEVRNRVLITRIQDLEHKVSKSNMHRRKVEAENILGQFQPHKPEKLDDEDEDEETSMDENANDSKGFKPPAALTTPISHVHSDLTREPSISEMSAVTDVTVSCFTDNNIRKSTAIVPAVTRAMEPSYYSHVLNDDAETFLSRFTCTNLCFQDHIFWINRGSRVHNGAAVGDLPLSGRRPSYWTVSVRRPNTVARRQGVSCQLLLGIANLVVRTGWSVTGHVSGYDGYNVAHNRWPGWFEGDVGVFKYDPEAMTLTMYNSRTEEKYVIRRVMHHRRTRVYIGMWDKSAVMVQPATEEQMMLVD